MNPTRASSDCLTALWQSKGIAVPVVTRFPKHLCLLLEDETHCQEEGSGDIQDEPDISNETSCEDSRRTTCGDHSIQLAFSAR
jgi:hypothetical protein